MPWWNREILVMREYELSGASLLVETEPEAVNDSLTADELRLFVEVQLIETGCRVDVYLKGGSDPSNLIDLSMSPALIISNQEVKSTDWPVPLTAYTAARVELHNSSGSPKMVSLRLLQTARLGG